jgi:transposase
LTIVLAVLAFELSAEAGARVTHQLQMAVSGDTLLRVIRHTAAPLSAPPRVLGIDDWAFKKRERYGTILVDLERHQVIELLPDRESETLAVWLQTQPGIEIISRDRASAYAEAAYIGAPQAIQVADRWHLLKNLGDTLATTYDGHQSLLRHIRVPTGQVPREAREEPVPPLSIRQADGSHQRPPTAQQQARLERRAYWLHKFQEVHTLRDQGLNQHAIARQTGLNIHTVRKYCRLPELPVKTSPKTGPRLIDPYRDYLRDRLLAENPSSRQLWREIQAQGFCGGHTVVYRCVADLRQALSLLPPRRKQAVPAAPTSKPLTARTLAALVLSPPGTLSDDAHQLIARACQLHPEIQRATHLACDFATLLRTHDAEQLDAWLQAAHDSHIASLVRFAAGLQLDYAAVRAAFNLPWSNGQVEGHINRLKGIKRQLYGRAHFDLLRLRVLHPP